MRTQGSPQQLERQRFRAIELIGQGHQPAQAARMLGVSQAAVCRWRQAYARAGPDGLRAKPHTGPPSRLTDRQKKQLEKMLLKGPRAAGYRTELWTLPRIAEVIEKRLGVTYTPANVWYLLKQMGWSCQKPERRARERNEEAIARWRKKDWSRIKKSKKNPM